MTKCNCDLSNFDPTITNIPLDCPRTWDLICAGDTKGVFQLESKLGQVQARRVKPRSIKELSDLISIIRPGCLDSEIDGKSLTQHYIDRKHGKEEVTYLHPSLEDILHDTHGILVYQESAILIAQKLAGFSLQEADKLRKCILGKCTFATPMGLVRIGDLANKKHLPRVLTVTSENRLVYRPLAAVWKTGVMPVICITTQYGNKIWVTPNHKIATSAGWVSAEELRVGSSIVVQCRGGICIDVVKSKVALNTDLPVYDYQMEDESLPYAFVNGILVHNSIGKKDPALMRKIKGEFLEGCEKTGIVSSRIAEEIFGWIEASQRYAFNKCLSPNTKVQTQNGIKTLRQLKVGDYVSAPTQDLTGSEYTKVLSVISNGIREVYLVELASGHSIVCTLDHKFLCDDRTVRPLYEILRQMGRLSLSIADSGRARIVGVKYMGRQDTMDITVDNNHHLFYGNGIVTSNSHAVAYAITAYQTAYAKAHFPQEFFTAYLRYADYDEIKELVNNARKWNITVLPPDIARKNATFEPVGDNGIAYGLRHIKGIGDQCIEQIQNTSLSSNRWYNILVELGLVINKREMEHLIKSGALDKYIVNRSRALYEYNVYRSLNTNERKQLRDIPATHLREGLVQLAKLKEENPRTRRFVGKIYGLITSLDNPTYGLFDSPEVIAQYERELLGTTLTAHEIDGKTIGVMTCTCLEFSEIEYYGKDEFRIAARIESLREYTTKSGREMCFMEISDGTYILDNVSVPPDVYDQYKHILYEGDTYLFTGVYNGRFKSFSVQSAEVLS